jgi:NADH:ubiquinone oxidoreductase subunit B-like Fe-S oxidoreductase
VGTARQCRQRSLLNPLFYEDVRAAPAGEESGIGLEDLNHNFLTGMLEDVVKWARARSVWWSNFGLACCAIELIGTGAANFDLARFGMEIFRASPARPTS